MMMHIKAFCRLLGRLRGEYARELAALREQAATEPPRESDFASASSRYPLLNARFRWTISQTRHARPNYAWGVLSGADLAVALGLTRISVIEFGVAGGNGLVALEDVAAAVERLYPSLTIDVVGFDAGPFGLPAAIDHRDMPHLWQRGYYPMEAERLRKRLKRARLVIGDVKETLPVWLASSPSPAAFIAFDLDLYSSTATAFAVLESDALLPRITCYFDDIVGYSYGDHSGERLAIGEFNDTHAMRKISQLYGLQHFIDIRDAPSPWLDQMFMAHIFDHRQYAAPDRMVTAAGERMDLVE